MICNKCKQNKNSSEFSFRNTLKGIRHKICKTCKKDIDNNDYHTKPGRKQSIRKAMKNSVTKLRKYVEEYKKQKCCSKCGDKRHYVLDFHHTEDKIFNISNGCQRGISEETLQKEMDKCILLCANCHRELHYLEKVN